MAVMYFGSEDPLCPQDHKVLKSELYSQLSAPDAVFDFIHQKLKKEKASLLDSNQEDDDSGLISNGDIQQPSTSSSAGAGGTSHHPPPSSSSDNEPSSSNRQPLYPARTPGPGGNVPKWFKLT
jgi:hypothetical protein